jgi:RNA polymerase sigma-70 factor, ECF subfamily
MNISLTSGQCLHHIHFVTVRQFFSQIDTISDRLTVNKNHNVFSCAIVFVKNITLQPGVLVERCQQCIHHAGGFNANILTLDVALQVWCKDDMRHKISPATLQARGNVTLTVAIIHGNWLTATSRPEPVHGMSSKRSDHETYTMASSQTQTSDSRQTSPTLLNRVRRKDAAAWQALVDLYGPLVLYWIQRPGLSQHDAADVLQEVFASVARSIDRFESKNRGSFRAWLWRITRNQLVDFFRQRARQTQAIGGSDAWLRLLSVSESLADNPDDFTEQTQLTDLHRRSMALVRSEFEQRTWQIFLRVTVDDNSTADVAEEFSITANAVRQIKSRVLRRLRQVLCDTESD